MMYTLNCCGRLVDLSLPHVMGILNVTPDSFYDGGKFNNESERRRHVEEMVAAGATFIDIGAASSRPGAGDVSEEEEWDRLNPALQMMLKNFPDVIVSVDTWRPSVAQKAIDSGACIINDITGGTFEAAIYKLAAECNAPYIMMHMQGHPSSMQDNPHYENVTADLLTYFTHRLKPAFAAGVKDIIIDPGFGFGKSTDHNFQLLRELDHFNVLKRPLLAGLSRKSMINKTLGIKANDALNGTTALNTIALMKGAKILRVHDVKEAVEAVNLYMATFINK